MNSERAELSLKYFLKEISILSNFERILEKQIQF